MKSTTKPFHVYFSENYSKNIRKGRRVKVLDVHKGTERDYSGGIGYLVELGNAKRWFTAQWFTKRKPKS